MDKKRIERNMLRMATVLAAVALILVCFALTQVAELHWRIVLFVCAGAVFSFSAFLIYLLILGRRTQKRDHNFFLYDRKRRANMPTEELTARHVSDCLINYMAFFRKRNHLYLSSLFDADGGAPEIFKPLFCYQLLDMLAQNGNDEQFDSFLSCGKELADAFSTYLAEAGEEELIRQIQVHIAQYDGTCVSSFRSYLQEKSNYFSERMLVYTKQHIHEFD